MIGRFTKIEAVLSVAAALAAAVAFAGFCRWLSWPMVDDAGIALDFGRTFFEGRGFRLTPNSQVVEGFSSPLHTLLLGLFAGRQSNPQGIVAGLGILLGAAGIFSLSLWGPLSEGRPPQFQDAVAPWLASSVPSLAGWVASGMETGLFILIVSLAGALSLRGIRLRRGTAAGCTLGMIAWVRPEAALYGLAAVMVWLSASAIERRNPLSEARQVAIGLLAVAGGYAALRWWYFADVVPNTYWAKKLWDFKGTEYIRGFQATYGWLLIASFVGAIISFIGGWPHGRRAVLATLFAAVSFVFSIVVKGDWLGEWRFLVPAIPFAVLTIEAGLSAVRARFLSARPLGQGVCVLLGVALLALSTGASSHAFRRKQEVKNSPQFSFAYVAGHSVDLARQMERLGQRRPLLGIPDVGASGWVLRNAEIMDVTGLADRALAYGAGNFARLEDYLVNEGPPTLVDAHGPSGHVGAFKKLMVQMMPWGDKFLLRELTDTVDPRCPDGKMAVLALAPGELLQKLEADVVRGEPILALRRWRCAWAYQPEDRLPSLDQRRRLAGATQKRSEEMEKRGDLESALRLSSLATVLADQDAHFRRRTENLRSRVFPFETSH